MAYIPWITERPDQKLQLVLKLEESTGIIIRYYSFAPKAVQVCSAQEYRLILSDLEIGHYVYAQNGCQLSQEIKPEYPIEQNPTCTEEVIKKIRQNGPNRNTPILVFGEQNPETHISKSLIDRILNAGANKYFDLKDVYADEFVNIVREYMKP